MTVWHRFGAQLAHPRGLAGRLTGRIMRLVNRAPNRLAIAALRLAPDDDVLELGFGPGEAIAALLADARRGRIHGIDGSRAMLAQATQRNRAGVAAGRVALRLGDFAELPYPDNSFDKVLAVNVAYFWSDPAQVAREIRRVLRPGGRLSLYATDAATMARWKFAGPATHTHITATALLIALAQGGFAPTGIDAQRHRLSGNINGLVIAAVA